MADIVSASKRSQMMAGIKSKDTKPEILVRQFLHRRGFRYRLHRRDLPGKPDIFLPKYKIAIFVNGCFWHKHDCDGFRFPKTNADFWRAKLEANVDRDRRKQSALMQIGVTPIIIWECETRSGKAIFGQRMDAICELIRRAVKS